MLPLRDVVEPIETWTPSGSNAEDELVYIDIGSVDRDLKQVVGESRIRACKAPSRARQVVRTGDVLVSTVRPALNAVAMIPAGLDGAVASTGFCVLRADPLQLDSSYLRHFVRSESFINRLVSRATGANYPAVSDAAVKDVELPIPALQEQRRIAAILDRADDVRRKRRESIRLADNLYRSTFLDMFGDPVTNPRGWPVIPLGEAGEFVGGGTPSRAVPEFYRGDTCWATSKDMGGRRLTDTQEHVTTDAIRRSATKVVPSGSVLMVVKSKVLAHTLPVAVAHIETCFGQDLKALLPGPSFPGAFIAEQLRIGQQPLLEQARGANTEGLTLDHLRNYRMIVPPRELCWKFSALDSRFWALTSQAARSSDDIDRLLSSLLHRAFAGEL